jgi:RHS repeat-associated protein
VILAGTDTPGNYTYSFSYDGDGNRLTETIVGGTTGNGSVDYNYNSDDQLYMETGTFTGNSSQDYITNYYYDANGNLTSEVRTGYNASTNTYSYDLRNRMTKSIATTTAGSTTTTYAYDTSSVLNYQSTVNSTSTITITYLNDPNNPTGDTKAIQLTTATTGQPTTMTSYVLGMKVEAQATTNGTPVYLLTDGHGSTRALVSNSGQVIAGQVYDYDAFGDALDFNAATAETTWLFGGDGFYDPSSGWTYQLARWRNGFWFTTMDSINVAPGDLGNANLYLYVGGNPINGIDPTGHDFSLSGLSVALAIQSIVIGLAFPAVAVATTLETGGSLGVGLVNSLLAGVSFFFITAKDGGVQSPKFWSDLTSVLVQSTFGVMFDMLGKWSKAPSQFTYTSGEANDAFWKNVSTFSESTALNIGFSNPIAASAATAATRFAVDSPGLLKSLATNLYDVFTGQPTDWGTTGHQFVDDVADAAVAFDKSFFNNSFSEYTDIPAPIMATFKALLWGGVDSLRKAVSKYIP